MGCKPLILVCGIETGNEKGFIFAQFDIRPHPSKLLQCPMGFVVWVTDDPILFCVWAPQPEHIFHDKMWPWNSHDAPWQLSKREDSIASWEMLPYVTHMLFRCVANNSQDVSINFCGKYRCKNPLIYFFCLE